MTAAGRLAALTGLAGALVLGAARPAAAQSFVDQEAALVSSPQAASEFFGTCVAVSGDRLVVGAPQDDGASLDPAFDAGAAWVFARVGTTWTFETKLAAAVPQATERFGECVAIDGTTLAVGAPGSSLLGVDAGTAYVFTFDGTSWNPQGPALLGAVVQARDHFGGALALDGDLLAIGARFGESTSNDPDAGRVHVFERSGTVWTEFATPVEAHDGTQPDTDAFDHFGSAVSLDGTFLAVGAPREDATLSDDSGAAYVYERSGGAWTPRGKLVPAARFAFAHFGDCVALSGDTLAVGEPLGLRATRVSGSLTTFERAGVVWTEDVTLFAQDATGNDRFGSCLALEGDRLVVGAWNDLHEGGTAGGPLAAIGSAYLFERDAMSGVWDQTFKVFPTDGAADDRFGAAVALSGDRIAVGAWQKDGPPGAEESGAAYAFGIRDASLLDLCRGDGGDQLGCTDCPCGNNALPGSPGGCINSSGAGSQLLGSGDASVTLPPGDATDLRFGLSGGPPSALCVLNSGDAVAPTNVANPCFGLDSGAQAVSFDGLRCAVQSTQRHGGRSTDASGDVGVTNNPWGGEGGPPAGLAIAFGGFVSGQTRYFQVIHRDDPAQVCMRGLNTSQATRVVFLP